MNFERNGNVQKEGEPSNQNERPKLSSGSAALYGAATAFALSGAAVLEAEHTRNNPEYFLDASEMDAIYQQADKDGISREDVNRTYSSIAPLYQNERERLERDLHEKIKSEILRILKRERST